jgi:hypothetical protein
MPNSDNTRHHTLGFHVPPTVEWATDDKMREVQAMIDGGREGEPAPFTRLRKENDKIIQSYGRAQPHGENDYNFSTIQQSHSIANSHIYGSSNPATNSRPNWMHGPIPTPAPVEDTPRATPANPANISHQADHFGFDEATPIPRPTQTLNSLAPSTGGRNLPNGTHSDQRGWAQYTTTAAPSTRNMSDSRGRNDNSTKPAYRPTPNKSNTRSR